MSAHSHIFTTAFCHIIKHVMFQLTFIFHIAAITLTFPLAVPIPHLPTLVVQFEITVYPHRVDVQIHIPYVGLHIDMKIGRAGGA